jgi:hypothetical protein
MPESPPAPLSIRGARTVFRTLFCIGIELGRAAIISSVNRHYAARTSRIGIISKWIGGSHTANGDTGYFGGAMRSQLTEKFFRAT